MSEQEEKVGPDAETESKDDVELHGKRRTMATDEQRDDSESDDDVELHGKQTRKTM